MAFKDEYVKKYDRSTLKILGTVGEPINPSTWLWYHDVVGNRQCAIVDTYWQTETVNVTHFLLVFYCYIHRVVM